MVGRGHDDYRARASVSRPPAGPGKPDGVGLAVLPSLRRHADAKVGQLPAPPLDAHGAPDGARVAPLVCALWADLLRGEPAPGPGELVRAGGAPRGARPLAAWWEQPAANRRVAPLITRQAGPLAALATAGPRPTGC